MPSANRNPIFPESITTDTISFANADGTAVKALATPGANGRNIRAIAVASDDTAAVTLVLSILKSAVTYKIGETVVPIGAGTNGTAKAVNLLNSVDATWLNPDGSIDLASGAVLQVNAKVAVTATKKVDVVAFGADY